ncbi:MAG: transcription elongation factor GreA [Clostridia bacterium]|nr:transcription elongation factor GreA [Clostridia bacterium]
MEKIILTAEGKKELENRLNVLKNELIPQVVQRIKVAREQGDLSENAEYTSARDEQAKLEGEKQDIENKLKFGEVIASGDKKDYVEVGTKLRYLDMEENEEYEYTIVGTAEADLAKGKISNESPLGKVLMGKKAGDVCTVIAPKGGSYQVKIIEILG